MARGNDVACREAGDTKSTLISASWPSYTLSSMMEINQARPTHHTITRGQVTRVSRLSSNRLSV